GAGAARHPGRPRARELRCRRHPCGAAAARTEPPPRAGAAGGEREAGADRGPAQARCRGRRGATLRRPRAGRTGRRGAGSGALGRDRRRHARQLLHRHPPAHAARQRSDTSTARGDRLHRTGHGEHGASAGVARRRRGRYLQHPRPGRRAGGAPRARRDREVGAYSMLDVATRPTFTRFRRLRRSEPLRSLVRETALSPSDFIYPLFIVHGHGVRDEISSMPGQYHLSLDRLPAEAEQLQRLGVPAVLLFGLPAEKDERGSEAYAEDGIVQQAAALLKREAPDLLVITDVCLCEYTSHGHCGLLDGDQVDNDSSLELIARSALTQAQAGADIVAPSDMMDGRVAAIRETLDRHGLSNVPIMAYAAKFASAFYGPFREAAESTPAFGDRRGYQMDPANGREALREIEADI